MKNEFLDFLNTKEIEPPKEILQKMYTLFEKDFLPINSFKLMVKFLFLNFTAGLFTLSICPQFGLGLSIGGHDISHYFMKIGVWACALFCAAFYIVIAQSISLLILSNKEIKWIAQKRFTVLPSLVIASFIALAMLGKYLNPAAQTMAFEIEFQVIWVLAGLIISQATFNVVSLKLKKISRSALR